MSKRERKRILRNVKQMYFDIIMHKIEGVKADDTSNYKPEENI